MDYNPHSPQNVGMEWVPIQQANFVPDNLNEFGYVMRIDQGATVVSGGIGINALQPQIVSNISEGVSVYPYDAADDMGPVRMVTIPIQSGTITGAARVFTFWGDPVATALANPTDLDYVQFFDAISSDTLGLNFGVTAFANELTGKRIVKIRLVYTAASDDATSLSSVQVGIARAAALSEGFTYQNGIDGFSSSNAASTVASLALNTDYNYVDIGDWNPVFAPGMTQFTTDAIFPWRYNELANLDTATPINVRQQITIFPGASTITFQIGYVALQVFYCEETRIAYGGRRPLVLPNSVGIETPLRVGENRVQLRSTAYATSTVLPPGAYLVTATHRSVSNFGTAKLPPTYAAIRQLNDPPLVLGQVIKPTIVIDDEYAVESTDVITDISLYTAVAAVTGTHVYANQLQAPVYGTITATQDIIPPANVVATTPFTQVRFYARRFGDTTQPLVVGLVGGTSAQSASIGVVAFDALDEIFDGWREVTLTLSAAITGSAGTGFAMVWSSAGETAGNQWQVLGATAFSSTPNSNVSTYNPPNGGTVELTWKSPNVTVSTIDAQSDATVILAQSPPTVTGFTLQTATQAITGVGIDCGVPNDCIPTGIDFTQLTWTLGVIKDTYSVDSLTTWPNTDTGQAWTFATEGLGTSIGVTGNAGWANFATINAGGGSRYFVLASPNASANTILRAKFLWPNLATGGVGFSSLISRYADINNHYDAQLIYGTDGTTTLRFVKTIAGSGSVIGPTIAIVGYVGQYINVAFATIGNQLYAKAWADGTDEPVLWQITVTDTDLTAAGSVGTRLGLAAGNTNAPTTLYVDDFIAASAQVASLSIEVQRRDEFDDDWQTILDTQDYSVARLDDYEARVGVASDYRIRTCDALDFCGPWVSGTGTIPAPGVTVPDDGTGVLIFTSNRAPNSNLAYPMVWDNRPTETFVFPEADTQTLQRMYGRDFQVAFRPLERGGEVFERVILVQAASIPLRSLANFNSLRDLAWDDLPYVCVRDELGNRWFANVLVPSGEVRRNRRLYLAQIRVTEVTDTAAPVLESP